MREVIVGAHSKVWSTVRDRLPAGEWQGTAIGHRDVEGFEFLPGDRVWVFSYSPQSEENRQLLERIAGAGVESLVYVSSSSAVVAEGTACYAYPRVKLEAERHASRVARARILVLGLVYRDVAELPSGQNVATSIEALARFLLAPDWTRRIGDRYVLFEPMSRAFSSRWERLCYVAYGHLMDACRGYPCLLRPLDLVLRAVGYRWYGYTYLSNRLWTRTMLS